MTNTMSLLTNDLRALRGLVDCIASLRLYSPSSETCVELQRSENSGACMFSMPRSLGAKQVSTVKWLAIAYSWDG